MCIQVVLSTHIGQNGKVALILENEEEAHTLKQVLYVSKGHSNMYTFKGHGIVYMFKITH
jgi:hypothetical protein